MIQSEFNNLLTNQIDHELTILKNRAAAYASDDNILNNFSQGAILCKTNSVSYAFNLMTKHILALQKLVTTLSGSQPVPFETLVRLEEYVTDIRNYAVLIKAIAVDTFTFDKADQPS